VPGVDRSTVHLDLQHPRPVRRDRERVHGQRHSRRLRPTPEFSPSRENVIKSGPLGQLVARLQAGDVSAHCRKWTPTPAAARFTSPWRFLEKNIRESFRSERSMLHRHPHHRSPRCRRRPGKGPGVDRLFRYPVTSFGSMIRSTLKRLIGPRNWPQSSEPALSCPPRDVLNETAFTQHSHHHYSIAGLFRQYFSHARSPIGSVAGIDCMSSPISVE